MPDDSPAIRHSIARLQKAREALARLESAKSLDEAESAWTDILLLGNGVYSKLEQGAKSGPAYGWFGRARKTRKDDPLLSYMHHARNSEEHGLEEVTSRFDVGQATITLSDDALEVIRTKGLALNIGVDHRGHVQVSSSDEKAASTQMFDKPSLALNKVRDPRYYDSFAPPLSHLGETLADKSPLAVGRLFLDYLAKLIDEARGFGV